MLEGFEPIKLVAGTPTMSVTKNGVSFNKTTVEKLDCPPYVIPMIDRIRRRFAIVARDYEGSDAKKFYQNGRDTSNGVRWNNNDLIATFDSMMGWNIDQTGMKVKGVYLEDDRAIIFDLNEANPICSEKRKSEVSNKWQL